VEVEDAEGGRSLMMRKVLLTPEKEVESSVQRNRLFRTPCKTKDRVCKVIVDSGSTDNLVSMEMVENLELETIEHPSPYKVSWPQKGHQVNVTKQCLVEFKIGGYNDKILCDVIPMDVCHLLLGRPWPYDRNVIHDGKMNTYTLEKNGRTHMLLPIKDKEVKSEVSNTVLLMSGKEILTEVKKKEEPQFLVVRKPKIVLTSTRVDDWKIDILIIETHTSKWVGLAVGETPRVNLNRPSTWDTCQKSEESRGSTFCESWRTCNSKSRSAILRKEESSMWDPADVISSKRGIENFHGENPKVARTVHSRGRVATIAIVVKFPERKVIHRKIVNREIGDSVDKRFSAFRHSKP
jgi:hypothetical protein